MTIRLLAILSIALLCACTTIRIGEQSSTRVRYLPGIAIVEIDAKDRAEVLSIQSFGFGVVGSSATLGWSKTEVALVPPNQCEVILWKASEAVVDRLAELLPTAQICGF